MKLQKASVFALYAVLELASEPGRQRTAVEIAEKYGISAHHLAKVLRDLGRAGIVDAVRGVGGGYRFTGNAKRLTLMDVIRLFEEPSAEADLPLHHAEADRAPPVGKPGRGYTGAPGASRAPQPLKRRRRARVACTEADA